MIKKISEVYHEDELKVWNPIEKYDAKSVEYGVGIAAFSSLFNYSCLPDVTSAVNDNGEITFVALKPIKKGSQVRKMLFNTYLKFYTIRLIGYLIFVRSLQVTEILQWLVKNL